jgi:hypothetical protein
MVLAGHLMQHPTIVKVLALWRVPRAIDRCCGFAALFDSPWSYSVPRWPFRRDTQVAYAWLLSRMTIL